MAPLLPDHHPRRLRARRARHLAGAALAAGLLLVAACGDGDTTAGVDDSSPQTRDGATSTAGGSSTTGSSSPSASGVSATEVGRFDQPIVLLPRPGTDELWLAERPGTVRRLQMGPGGRLEAQGEPVLDISGSTRAEGERGLLGMAFSPDGDTLVVSSTNLDGDTRVDSYPIEGSTVARDGRKELLAVDQPFPNHNGGNVVVGPDGKLWFGLGDGGSRDDPDNRAQDPDTLLGKIIRFPIEGGTPEIVVTGVRNPWRFAFDTDGSLWIGDVGQDHIEEIDRLPAGEIEGANMGWSGYEGKEPYLDGAGRRAADAVPPVFEYTHESGGCSITGGFVYRGTTVSDLAGAYVFADYCAGNLRAITLDDRGAFDREIDLGIHVPTPISFGTDADGEVYVLSSEGPVMRLEASS
jgi:glucose/arabinose dehydrogenase